MGNRGDRICLGRITTSMYGVGKEMATRERKEKEDVGVLPKRVGAREAEGRGTNVAGTGRGPPPRAEKEVAGFLVKTRGVAVGGMARRAWSPPDRRFGAEDGKEGGGARFRGWVEGQL